MVREEMDEEEEEVVAPVGSARTSDEKEADNLAAAPDSRPALCKCTEVGQSSSTGSSLVEDEEEVGVGAGLVVVADGNLWAVAAAAEGMVDVALMVVEEEVNTRVWLHKAARLPVRGRLGGSNTPRCHLVDGEEKAMIQSQGSERPTIRKTLYMRSLETAGRQPEMYEYMYNFKLAPTSN